MKKYGISKIVSIALCGTLFLGTASLAEVTKEDVVKTELVKQATPNKEGLQKFLDFWGKFGMQDNISTVAGEITGGIDSVLNPQIPADAYLGGLSGIFDTITGGVESAIQGSVKFDPETIPLRIKNAVALTKMIIKAATPAQIQYDENGNIIGRTAVPGSLYLKPQKILTQFGFLVSGIILDAFNPLTTKGTLSANLERLQVIYQGALSATDIEGNDVANSNIRQELANTLIKARWSITHNAIRWGNQSYLFEDLKNQVSGALPVRLGTKESVSDVTDIRNQVNQALNDFEQEILDNAKVVRAQAQDREPLAKTLRKYRWYLITSLKNKSPKAKAEFEKALQVAFKTRMDWDSTIKDVQDEIIRVKVAYEKIKNSKVAQSAVNLKDEIVKLQKEARILKKGKKFIEKMRLQRAINSSTRVLKYHRHSEKKLQNAINSLTKAINSVK